MIPPKDGLLVESFTRKNYNFRRNYIVAYTFQGRAANQTLGIVILKKMLALKCQPIAFIATDYAIVFWSAIECKNIKLLFNHKNFFEGFDDWLKNTSLIRQNDQVCTARPRWKLGGRMVCQAE